MKKIFQKVLSVVLSLAMILTSITVYNTTAKAALAGSDIETNIKNASYNLALNKNITVHPGIAEGQKEYLNDGVVDNTNANHAALSSGWGYSGESYAVIDLGDYYDASSLDQILVQYKDAADNDTVLNKTFNISYSIDDVNFTTIYTSETVTEFDADNCVTTDVSTATGVVRYIKISYPQTPTYGIQISEIAVFSANPVLGEVATCDDAAGVTVSSDTMGEIVVNITAGEGQEGYKYNVLLDDDTEPSLIGCDAGVDYTIHDVKSGAHRVKVIATYNGALSSGIVSDEVVVKTIYDYLADGTKNLAYGKTYELSSDVSTEGSGSVTDGVANGEYATPTKGQPGSYFIIDLGEELDPTGINSVHVFYRIRTGGCYPENGGQQIQFSKDKSEWTTVGTLTQGEFNQQIGDAPFDVVTKDLNVTELEAVRYVRVYYPNAVAYGAQVTEIAVMGTAKAATPSVEVAVPAAVTATSPAYNTIVATVTAPEGHDDYTYEVTVNGETKVVAAGEEVIFTGVPSGTYTVSAKSVDADGHKSHAITSNEVEVKDSFTYTSTTAANDAGRAFPDTNANGNNYVRFAAVSGAASTGDAAAALDNNVGSRWESAQSDPQWISVNLGSVYSVKEIDSSWETANAKDYDIEVSIDGNDWTKVATITGAAAGANRVDTIVLNDAVDAQYVRLTGTARTTNYGHSIWEMAIYGPSTEKQVEEEAPDQTITDTDWVKVASNDANASQKSTYDTSYFVSETYRNAHIPYNDILGLYDNHADSAYHEANCTLTGSAFVFAFLDTITVDGDGNVGKVNTSTIKSIWIDGIKYTSGTEVCYFEADQIHLSQSLFVLPEGVDEKVFPVTVRTVDKDYTFGVKVAKVVYHNVIVDGGETVQVEEGTDYMLGDAQYGYFCDGKMYAPNTAVEVTADMVFTSVKELSITMANGAGIRYAGTAGIRFQSAIASDNMDAVASAAIMEGTLITANDIYEANGTPLTLTSDYTKLNVVNSGWYNGTVGTYCGSICDVIESNYIRNFTARAYVTINYENADALTIYSAMGPVRSISQVATAVKNAGYPGIAEESKSIIDSFIK